MRSVDTKCSGTLPWVSVEWLNQENFSFFLSGKPAGVLPFTDKMVKYQEQDINREHAASDRQKKKTRNSACTWHPLLSENFITWIKSTKWKNKVHKNKKYYIRPSEDNLPLLRALFKIYLLRIISGWTEVYGWNHFSNDFNGKSLLVWLSDYWNQ